MKKFNMVVSKKEDNVYKEVGRVDVFYPLLSELGFAVEPDSFDKETTLPLYSDEKAAYAFDAIFAAVKSAARNKLVSKTSTLKDGNKIAETLEELLAEGEGNSGEALKIRREYFASLKAYMPTLGKGAAYNAAIYDLISNVKNIVYQGAGRKATIKEIVLAHGLTLSAEDVAKWSRVMTQIVEQTEAADPLA